jgi:hypothetical protein
VGEYDVAGLPGTASRYGSAGSAGRCPGGGILGTGAMPAGGSDASAGAAIRFVVEQQQLGVVAEPGARGSAGRHRHHPHHLHSPQQAALPASGTASAVTGTASRHEPADRRVDAQERGILGMGAMPAGGSDASAGAAIRFVVEQQQLAVVAEPGARGSAGLDRHHPHHLHSPQQAALPASGTASAVTGTASRHEPADRRVDALERGMVGMGAMPAGGSDTAWPGHDPVFVETTTNNAVVAEPGA